MNERALIYIRVKPQGTCKARLAARQDLEEALRRACAEQGREVNGVFVDESFGNTLTRPGLGALRRRVAQGQANVVVCPELEQWTTRAGDFLRLLDDLGRQGVQFSIPGAGPAFDKVIQAGRAAIAAFEEYLRAERQRKKSRSVSE